MKNPMVFLILALFLTGCASYHTKSKVIKPKVVAPKKATSSIQEKPVALVGPAYFALWEVLGSLPVSLQLTNVDDGTRLTVILEKGLSLREVPPGHWELTGFEKDGRSFVSMNTSKKFVFRMQPRRNVYAGSIVIGCPKIYSGDLKLLRRMKFFNRYPFSSSLGLCELVIGNDFVKVRSELGKVSKSKKLKLINTL